MLRKTKTTLLLAGWIGLAPALLVAQTASPVQASTRPYGLGIVSPVEMAGSDTASNNFQQNVLPDIAQLVNTTLGETLSQKDISAMQLDPSKLKLATDATARVYFVGEGAGYHNTIGFNALPKGGALPAGGLDSSAKLIFPDASSSVSTYDPAQQVARSAHNPLLPGDFADLGKFSAGTSLDFFLISNGANGGSNVFTADASRNPDGINHVVSFALKDSPFLILAFEDLFGGGDRDFNDSIIALDIGYENVQRLLAAPEPGTWAILGSFLALGLCRRRRPVAGHGA